MRAITLAIILLLIAPVIARAETPISVTVWGLSYHLNRDIPYENFNAGLGIRYGSSRFVELDAIRNSHNGLLIPLSIGFARPLIGPLGWSGALTLAYYRTPSLDLTEVRVGPVGGVWVRVGKVTVEVIAVPSTNEPIAVLTGVVRIQL